MPVVGFHQARRPRQTHRARIKRELSWPRPGGIALSLAGAAIIFSGAQALAPGVDPGLPSPAAAPAHSLTTPDTSAGPARSSASTQSSASPAETQSGATPSRPAQQPSKGPSTLSGAGSSPSPITGTAAAPLVAGAAADSPLQKLFESGNATPKDRALWDINDPGSPLALVNKRRPLHPEAYVPANLVVPAVEAGSAEPPLLRADAAAAAERMFAAAAADGVRITIKSSYRSFDTQVSVYNGYVANKGTAATDTTSARPGFSEHQTGLAMDIGDANAGTACDFSSCFASTAAARWVAAHGADYGFVVRYAPGEESVTGYLAEPWHLRYLGIPVARDMGVRGIHSYEEYAGLPGAPDYK